MLKQDFNQDWIFTKEDKTAQPCKVTLPHDAMICEARGEQVITGAAGGYFPGGNYTYTKKFMVPEEDGGRQWLVEFEGAYLDSYVYLNKCFVMSNHSGHRAFTADLSPYLEFGKENVLEVQVKNDTVPNVRWYSGSGLYRPVWLYKAGDVHIPINGVRITTPDVERDVSKVVVTVAIENRLRRTQKIRLAVCLKDADGATASSENYPVTLFPEESPVITVPLYVRDARLWSLDDPYLYTCEVQLLDDERVMDETVEHFGIRRVQIDPVKGLRLNGERIQLKGSCIHQDHGIIGNADFADAQERKIRLSKAAGFNALRIAHQSASRALLEACDKYGVLLMEESFDQWHQSKVTHDFSRRFDAQWEQEVEAIVAKDYNHPSVIMYSIGNEILELGRPDGIRMSRRLSEKFRQLDPYRAVTNAVNGGMTLEGRMFEILMDMGVLSQEQAADMGKLLKGESLDGDEGKMDINDLMTIFAKHMNAIVAHRFVSENVEEVFSHLDVCGYNYMMARYEGDMANHPNRIILGSETNPPKIDKLWAYTKEYPACLGDFTWTGWDYIGESGIGITRYNEKKAFGEDYPVYLAYCGDMDITGFRMPVSYYREIVFGLRKAPYLSVQAPVHFEDETSNSPWAIPETLESWTWAGNEGKPVKVTVFSASSEVALFCNDEEVGRAACGESCGYKAVIETVYCPGELCVVGYTNGKEDGRFSIRTAKPEVQIKSGLTKTTLSSDGSDLSYLTIEVTDKTGTVHCESERKISLELEGGIKLLGFGSADPYSRENFYDSCRTTWHGRALAAIRGCAAGPAAVIISAEGCEPVRMEVEIV